jgi:hypothetical protein
MYVFDGVGVSAICVGGSVGGIGVTALVSVGRLVQVGGKVTIGPEGWVFAVVEQAVREIRIKIKMRDLYFISGHFYISTGLRHIIYLFQRLT